MVSFPIALLSHSTVEVHEVWRVHCHQKYKEEERWEKWLLGLTSYHQHTVP